MLLLAVGHLLDHWHAVRAEQIATGAAGDYSRHNVAAGDRAAQQLQLELATGDGRSPPPPPQQLSRLHEHEIGDTAAGDVATRRTPRQTRRRPVKSAALIPIGWPCCVSEGTAEALVRVEDRGWKAVATGMEGV